MALLKLTEQEAAWEKQMGYQAFPPGNPRRLPAWSSPYHDHDQNGILVTLTMPLDFAGYFFSAFAIDVIGEHSQLD